MTTSTLAPSEMTTKDLRAACKAAGIAYSGSDRKADLIAKIDAHRTPQPEPTPEPAAVNRADRARLAKAERKALDAWNLASFADPKNAGARPATPNLDAINAEVEAGVPPAQRGAKTAKPTARRERPARYEEARTIAARGEKRGAGTKIEEDALVEWIKAERERSPGITRNQAEQVSYWVERFAVGIDRFNAAWDRTA